MLFFKRMTTLLNPCSRREDGTELGRVSYTVALFSSLTVRVAAALNIYSISFIDNRKFTSTLLGPLGEPSAIRLTASGAVPNLMFFLVNFLADGLLVGFLFNAASARPGV